MSMSMGYQWFHGISKWDIFLTGYTMVYHDIPSGNQTCLKHPASSSICFMFPLESEKNNFVRGFSATFDFSRVACNHGFSRFFGAKNVLISRTVGHNFAYALWRSAPFPIASSVHRRRPSSKKPIGRKKEAPVNRTTGKVFLGYCSIKKREIYHVPKLCLISVFVFYKNANGPNISCNKSICLWHDF